MEQYIKKINEVKQRLSKLKEVESEIKSLDTPQKIVKFLGIMFQYDMAEQKELFSNGKKAAPPTDKILKSGKGTCFTMSRFVKEYLKDNYEVKIFKLVNPNKPLPHIIPIIKEMSGYYVCGDAREAGLLYGPFQSIEKLQVEYDQKWFGKSEWSDITEKI